MVRTTVLVVLMMCSPTMCRLHRFRMIPRVKQRFERAALVPRYASLHKETSDDEGIYAKAIQDEAIKRSLHELGLVRTCRIAPVRKTVEIKGAEWQELGLCRKVSVSLMERFVNLPRFEMVMSPVFQSRILPKAECTTLSDPLS